ncbi:hypothetical protein AQUCO_00500006v1 [Aquilegia coerulea]|uniref:Uncharacterized protein n=1 Tax=Aquilegia coerulea TaxID=218851 RepID=A0A2G5EPV1_AQUCA|nr:hypothetical protein AQUCO_00500006v1 [Aquilegia coerulea]
MGFKLEGKTRKNLQYLESIVSRLMFFNAIWISYVSFFVLASTKMELKERKEWGMPRFKLGIYMFVGLIILLTTLMHLLDQLFIEEEDISHITKINGGAEDDAAWKAKKLS